LKKIFIIFNLILNILYANDTQLSEPDKLNLLESANKYCYENYQSYESLLKDRYFSCEMDAPDELHNLKGDVILKSNTSIWKREVVEFGILLAIILIVGAPTLLIFHIAEKRVKEKNNSKRLGWIKFYKTRIIILVVVSLVYIGVINVYKVMTNYSIETLRNGNIEDVKIALPLFNAIKKEETALLLAVSNGRLEIVRYLIEEKSNNPNKIGKIGREYHGTPLDLALKNESFDIADYLKIHLPVSEPINIITASKSFDLDLLKSSIKYGNHTNEDIQKGFLVSIRFKDYNAMKYLYDLNSTIIYNESIKHERWSMIPLEQVINEKIYQWVRTISPLELAIKYDNLQAVEFLVSKGVNPNKCGVLSDVAYRDNVKIFSFLLDNGADINLECKNDNIALSIARGKAKKMEELFIEKGWSSVKDFQKMKDDIYYGIK